jgi:hypothetical protein
VSSDDRAARQLRASPGGRTPRSRRRRPELPPSSVTVTMAVRRSAHCATFRSPAAARTASASPRSTTGRPVPPPNATMRGNVGALATGARTRRGVGSVANTGGAPLFMPPRIRDMPSRHQRVASTMPREMPSDAGCRSPLSDGKQTKFRTHAICATEGHARTPATGGVFQLVPSVRPAKT